MNIIELETVGSTNDHARQIARAGAAAGTVVWAHEQTSGRGRQGHHWVSLSGNLFMSLILRPKTAPADIGQLSFLSAVALANALEEILPATVRIHLKWPNDLLLNGKKAAGILIETEGDFAIVGIGVNITGAPKGATFLKALGAEKVEAGRLLEGVAGEVDRLAGLWEKEGFQDIREAWLARAYKLGEEITARLPQQTLTGIFKGLDKSGALQLQMPDGTLKIVSSGEIFI